MTIHIDAFSLYSASNGYGWEQVPATQIKDRAVSGSGSSLSFRIDVPAGDYNVSITVPINVDTQALCICVNGVQINKKWNQREQEQVLVFDFALLTESMNFKMNGNSACVSKISVCPLPKRWAAEYPSLFLISDSTASEYTLDRAPLTGWGQVIHRFFKPEIHIKNHAVSGRSTKSAYAEGLLNDVLVDIRPGDYLFIQFAHNDEAPHKTERFVTTCEYKDYLNNYYVKGTVERGAIPICLTSMSRRSVHPETGRFLDTFPAYTQAMKEVAAENKLSLLDLNKKSLAYYDSLGYEGTASIFMQLKPGESPNYPLGLDDNTHFKEAGAKQMAKMITEEIQEKIPELSFYALAAHQVLGEVFKDTEKIPEREQIEKIASLGVMKGANEEFNPELPVHLKDYLHMLHTLTGISLIENMLNEKSEPSAFLIHEEAANFALHAYKIKKNIPATGPFSNQKKQSALSFFWPSDADQPDPEAAMNKRETAVLLYKLYTLLRK